MKQRGFADKVIGQLTGSKPMDVYKYRKAMGISPVYKMVDTCGGELQQFQTTTTQLTIK